MAAILGVDHGEARVGLAVSDALGMLAHPLETIHVQKTEPMARIAAVVRERSIQKIVYGLPFRIDGSEGTAAAKVRDFAEQVEKLLPEVPIEFVDERLTTVSAQEKLHAAGRNIKNSRNVIDQAAAVQILQDYLDQASGPEASLLPDPDEYP